MADPTRDPVPWELAGGPDECAHGYAAGVPCLRCELQRVRASDPPGFLRDAAEDALVAQIERTSTPEPPCPSP